MGQPQRVQRVIIATPAASPPGMLSQVLVGACAGVLAWFLVEHVAKPATGRRR